MVPVAVEFRNLGDAEELRDYLNSDERSALREGIAEIYQFVLKQGKMATPAVGQRRRERRASPPTEP